MKVDGNNAQFWFFSNEQQHREATVKREQSPFDLADLLSGRSRERLTIDAGDGDDEIHVKKTGNDQYTVTVNGQEFTLSKAEMERLTIDGGAGNDKIVVDQSVDVGITVRGGDGNDQIHNFSDSHTLDGGSGDDFILSIGHGNTLRGGGGSDDLYVFGHFNTVESPSATEQLLNAFGGARRDRVTVQGLFNFEG